MVSHHWVMLKRLLLGALVSFGCLAGFSAQAAHVAYEGIGDVRDMEIDVIQLGMLEAGTYELTVTDIQLQAPLTNLEYVFGTATGVLDRYTMGPDYEAQSTRVIDITAPGSYFLSVFAVAGGDYQMGSYGVSLLNTSVAGMDDVAPVPLPLPAFLFLSGLGALAAMKRRN